MRQATKLALYALAATLAGATGASEREQPGTDAVIRVEKDELGRLTSVTTVKGTTRYGYFEGVKQPFLREVLHADGTKDEFSFEAASSTPSFLAPSSASDPLSQSHNRFLFTGYLWEDELKLYLTPSGRLYDPALGRFIQQDSHLGEIGKPPSLHRYFYANANPTRFIDPTGHESAIVTLASLDPKARRRLEDQAAATGYNAAWASGAVLQQGVEAGKALVAFGQLAMDEQAQAAFLQGTAANLRKNAPTIARALDNDPFARAELIAPVIERRMEAYERGVDAYAATKDPVLRGRIAVETVFPEASTIALGVSPYVGRVSRAIEGLVVEGRSGPEFVRAIPAAPDAVRPAAPSPVSASALSMSAPARPSWQYAEAESAADLAEFGFRKQPSYLGGKEVPYGTPGSVRPDLASENLKLAVDVKNYNVTTPQGRYRLVQDIVGQAGPRAANLQDGLRQGVIIDVRNQQISDTLLNRMIERIVRQSDGAIRPENIHVRR